MPRYYSLNIYWRKIKIEKAIQICTLYSLEHIEAYYYITEDLKVININDGTVKSVCSPNTRYGYPYVTLQRSDTKAINCKVSMHKIVALAFIVNEPYEIIEHNDNDKQNYRPANLKFSNQKANLKNAQRDGLCANKKEIFNLELYNGIKLQDTVHKLSEKTNIPEGTIYDNLNYPRTSRKIKNISRTGMFVK